MRGGRATRRISAGQAFMGQVVVLARRHTRASREASSVKAIAVTPAARAVSERKTGAHQSAGIESRCHHLLTEPGLAPTSDAIASRDGQSSMTERNESMQTSLGQSVLIVKAKPSLDVLGQAVLQLGMSKTQPSEAFKRAFLARTKAAREAKGLTQEQMARLLGLKQDRYKQYETRTMLPHELIPAFCHETGASVTAMFPDRRILNFKSEKQKTG